MKKYILPILISILFASCTAFIDIIPKGNAIPSTVDDLAMLMNLAEQTPSWDHRSEVQHPLENLELMTDDAYLTSALETSYAPFASASIAQRNAYTFQPYIYATSEADLNWNSLYKSNYILNYILDKIDEVKDGLVYERDDTKARALYHRAESYFYLTNIYGKQYDKNTSSTDLSVPLILVSDISISYPRSTVEQVYQSILSDLNTALPLIDRDYHEFNHIPGTAAIYSLLSRVHLFMGNYDEAFEAAENAVKIKSYLIDYNTIKETNPGIPLHGLENYGFTFSSLDPELMSGRNYTFIMTTASESLLSVFEQVHDLRFRYMLQDMSNLDMSKVYMVSNMITSPNISIAEIFLTKAEAALRMSSPDVAAAVAALDKVRVNRIATAGYSATTTTDVEALLRLVLNERRKETRLNSLRFFDLKRLNKDPKTAVTITRVVEGTTYTLEPNSPLYQFPIPLNVMQFNDKLIQNPAPGR